jgi:4-amino-4-deoxy-L-arabinose transferase-like glycosyltransferase
LDHNPTAPVERERLSTPLAAGLLAIIVLLAVGVRVAWIAYANVNPLDGRFDDSVFYFTTANSLAHDFSFRDNFGRLTAHWPPGYPLALSGVFWAVGTHLLAAKALNLALAGATVVLTYALGTRAFDVRVGLLSALLLALSPGHIYFTTLVLTEVLFAFGFLTVTAMLIWWAVDDKRARWQHLLALGIATGCLTLVRAEAVFLPIAFAVLWKALLTGWRPALRYGAIFGLGFVLALTPWTVRNALRFHEFLPLRDGSHGALSNGLDRRYPHRLDRFSTPAPPLSETFGYMERHPWELIPLHFEKLRNLYRDDSDGIYWIENAAPHAKPPLTVAEARRWSLLADWYFYGVGVAALFGAALLLRSPTPRRGALAYVIVAWTAIEIITWPETRYHLPLIPLICMFAAWGVWGWTSEGGS